MTNIFISHSSKDKEFAMKLYSWFNDFRFIENVWIDIKELKPGMKLKKTFFDAIDNADIVIVIVSRYSKDSKWVKAEIKHSLKFEEKKIVIPILYKIKRGQISLENTQQQKLLENKYVGLDGNLFNIHEIIPSLIPDSHIVEISLNNYFHIDITRLIDNLREYSEKEVGLGQRKVYALIDHESFDKQIVTIFEELLNEDNTANNVHKFDIFRRNFLPLFWVNTCLVLSKYIQQSIPNGANGHYTMIAKSIYNLFEELLHSLFLHIFDRFGSLTIIMSNKSKEMKERMKQSAKYVSPIGSYDAYFYFICNLYYNNNITPNDLVEFNFLGRNKIRKQKGFLSKYGYESTKQLYLPAIPASEIRDSDWYEKILPQFLSYEIIHKTANLHTFNENDMEEIGFDIQDYCKLY